MIPMTPIDRLREATLVLFPDAVPAVVDEAIVTAAQQLYPYLKEQRDFALPVQAGVHEYSLRELVSDDLTIEAVREVRHGGCCLRRRQDCFNCAETFSVDAEGWLTLDPAPAHDSTDEYEVVLELGVADGACAIPTILTTRYNKALRNAVWAEMYLLPGMPWSDPSRAEYYGHIAKAVITEAMTHKALDGKSGLQIQQGETIL